MRVLFSCGGTGGHINPALAMAKQIRAKRPESEICFVGAEGGMETKLIPKEGFPLKVIDIQSVNHKLTPAAALRNLKILLKMPHVLRQARHIIEQFKPDVVVGTGGYASFPVIYRATSMGIPTLIHESNAVPGLATKMLSGRVDRIMVSFEDSIKHYTRKDAVVVTGTPVREGFVFEKKEEAKKKLGYDDRPVVISYWGSLGAREMNKIIADFILLESRSEPYYHVHATGSFGYRWMPERLQKMGIDLSRHKSIQLKEYIYNMPELMAAADLVICRGGASTLSELAAAGRPAIIVPSPNVAGNHQEKNARVLEARGAALVLLEKECTGEKLYSTVNVLLQDKQRLDGMAQAMKDMAVLDAAERIYKNIIDLGSAVKRL